MDVPSSVVDLIVDLRAFLQDKCEPPVYVSDRRLVKSVSLLRVCAYTNGREAVSEFDCLLLANILWQRPSECQMIRDWILERLAQDRGVEQVQYLLAGLFGRACRADGDPEECRALAAEASSLREVLTTQMRSPRGRRRGRFRRFAITCGCRRRTPSARRRPSARCSRRFEGVWRSC